MSARAESPAYTRAVARNSNPQKLGTPVPATDEAPPEPGSRQTFASTVELIDSARSLAPLDADRFRADVDRFLDQSIDPR